MAERGRAVGRSVGRSAAGRLSLIPPPVVAPKPEWSQTKGRCPSMQMSGLNGSEPMFLILHRHRVVGRLIHSGDIDPPPPPPPPSHHPRRGYVYPPLMYISPGCSAHTTAKLISVVLWLFLLGHALKHNYAQAARRHNNLTDAGLVALSCIRQRRQSPTAFAGSGFSES